MYENSNQDQCGIAAMIASSDRQMRGATIAYEAKEQCAGMRQTAKGAIRNRIMQLRREADRLEALSKALPEELPTSADEALWDLVRATHK